MICRPSGHHQLSRVSRECGAASAGCDEGRHAEPI